VEQAMCLENQLKNYQISKVFAEDPCYMASWVMTPCSLVYVFRRCTTQHNPEQNVTTKFLRRNPICRVLYRWPLHHTHTFSNCSFQNTNCYSKNLDRSGGNERV